MHHGKGKCLVKRGKKPHITEACESQQRPLCLFIISFFLLLDLTKNGHGSNWGLRNIPTRGGCYSHAVHLSWTAALFTNDISCHSETSGLFFSYLNMMPRTWSRQWQLAILVLLFYFSPPVMCVRRERQQKLQMRSISMWILEEEGST